MFREGQLEMSKLKGMIKSPLLPQPHLSGLEKFYHLMYILLRWLNL